MCGGGAPALRKPPIVASHFRGFLNVKMDGDHEPDTTKSSSASRDQPRNAGTGKSCFRHSVDAVRLRLLRFPMGNPVRCMPPNSLCDRLSNGSSIGMCSVVGASIYAHSVHHCTGIIVHWLIWSVPHVELDHPIRRELIGIATAKGVFFKSSSSAGRVRHSLTYGAERRVGDREHPNPRRSRSWRGWSV